MSVWQEHQEFIEFLKKTSEGFRRQGGRCFQSVAGVFAKQKLRQKNTPGTADFSELGTVLVLSVKS
jgi:hypothetical protein